MAMPKPKKAKAKHQHRLEILDRNDDGRQHRHRWLPVCSCGLWWGIGAVSKSLARRQHSDHFTSVTRRRKRTRVETRVGPRPVTPEADLPEALRRPA